MNTTSLSTRSAEKPVVLIIDDDADLCDFITEVVESLGYKTEVAQNATEFEESLRSVPFLIILDLIMPDVDGIELLRILSVRNCSAPIVLMSGLDRSVLHTAEDLARELGLTVVSRLQKPFRLEELKGLFREPANFVTAEADRTLERRSFTVTADEVRRGLERHEFFLHYQPQVDIRTGRPCGVEALVRWQHPVHKFVPPDRFVAAVESFGLIEDFTAAVLTMALADWRSQIGQRGNLSMSVNISAISLTDLSFPDRVVAVLSENSVPPANLILEITESGLVKDLTHSLDILVRLRMKQIRLSIDDFGTGFSMLQQLRRVPATELKVDKSFVDDMLSDTGAGSVVKKTIELGHELNMQVVAEGVETQGQLDMLNEYGCDIIQGYFFSRPLPLAELLPWLDSRVSADTRSD